MAHTVRQLGPDDADIYRAIRLEMLCDLPQAFASSYEEVSKWPVERFRNDLSSDRAFFGAFDGGRMIGSVNFLREAQVKQAHRGWLLGMYVAPKARGTGCAGDLIDRLIAHARTQVLQVHLGVGAFNERARRLYEKAGFTVYASEPRALLVNGKFYDEHFMVRFLDKDNDNE